MWRDFAAAMTRTARVAALLPLALLCACQDPQARARNAELERRVAALEAQVQALEAADPGAASGQVPPTQAAAITARASAQNCAAELSRALEGFRRLSLEGRYPTERELNLPPACEGETLSWEKRTAQAYAFTVRSAGGEVIARQSGP